MICIPNAEAEAFDASASPSAVVMVNRKVFLFPGRNPTISDSMKVMSVISPVSSPISSVFSR